MANPKQRLMSQGITLEQFAFQFVVVLLGVYLAVVIEGKAGDRSRKADAEATLLSVLSELTLDEEEMETALETQRNLARDFTTMADLLAAPSAVGEAVIDSIMKGMFMRTAFPRRSAYTALLASGDLGYITDRGLALELVDLYEHHYVRLGTTGRVLDDTTVDWFPLQAQFWNRATGRLILAGEDENIPLRNLYLQRALYSGFYVSRAEETLNQLRAVKGRLEAYLAQ